MVDTCAGVDVKKIFIVTVTFLSLIGCATIKSWAPIDKFFGIGEAIAYQSNGGELTSAQIAYAVNPKYNYIQAMYHNVLFDFGANVSDADLSKFRDILSTFMSTNSQMQSSEQIIDKCPMMIVYKYHDNSPIVRRIVDIQLSSYYDKKYGQLLAFKFPLINSESLNGTWYPEMNMSTWYFSRDEVQKIENYFSQTTISGIIDKANAELQNSSSSTP